MAQITRFAETLLEHDETEPESIRLFRKLAESEDIRILLGDFFLELAASETEDRESPHADLLRRMIGGRTPDCESQLEILAKNLDLLRQYDIGKAARARFIRRAGEAGPYEQKPADKTRCQNIARTGENKK